MAACISPLDLPDHVLEQIITFLPLKDAGALAQTCRRMRSIRWRVVDVRGTSPLPASSLSRIMMPGVQVVWLYAPLIPPLPPTIAETWRSLMHLRLVGVDVGCVAKVLKMCTQLTTFHVSAIDEQAWAASCDPVLQLVAQHQKLRNLRIECSMTGLQPPDASQPPPPAAVQDLELAGSSASTGGVAENKSLEFLVICHGKRHGHRTARALQRLARCLSALHTVCLDDISLPGADLLSRLAQQHGQLRSVSLQGNHGLCGRSLRTMMGNAPQLTELFLGWTGLTDSGAELLAEGLRLHTQLVVLYLPCNPVTSVGIAALLDAIGPNHALHCFNVASCMGFDERAAKAVVRAATETGLGCLTLDGLNLADSLPAIIAMLNGQRTGLGRVSMIDCQLTEHHMEDLKSLRLCLQPDAILAT